MLVKYHAAAFVYSFSNSRSSLLKGLAATRFYRFGNCDPKEGEEKNRCCPLPRNDLEIGARKLLHSTRLILFHSLLFFFFFFGEMMLVSDWILITIEYRRSIDNFSNKVEIRHYFQSLNTDISLNYGFKSYFLNVCLKTKKLKSLNLMMKIWLHINQQLKNPKKIKY